MRWKCRRTPTALLREVWRVLAAGGQLLAVVPNRRGLWARMDTTPFGHGRPYSRSQITHLLREAWFTPVGWGEALYVPPIERGWFLRSAVAWERAGATHLGAVRRRAYRRGDQAGLSRDPGAAREARLVPALEPVLAPSPGRRARLTLIHQSLGRPRGANRHRHRPRPAPRRAVRDGAGVGDVAAGNGPLPAPDFRRSRSDPAGRGGARRR